MAKFYVESGTLQLVVIADDVQRAALWSVHRAMQQVLPLDDEEGQSPELKSDGLSASGGMVLGDTLRINERGFGRSDGAVLDTFEVVTEWNQLMVAIARLENDLNLHGEPK